MDPKMEPMDSLRKTHHGAGCSNGCGECGHGDVPRQDEAPFRGTRGGLASPGYFLGTFVLLIVCAVVGSRLGAGVHGETLGAALGLGVGLALWVACARMLWPARPRAKCQDTPGQPDRPDPPHE